MALIVIKWFQHQDIIPDLSGVDERNLCDMDGASYPSSFTEDGLDPPQATPPKEDKPKEPEEEEELFQHLPR